MGVLCCGCTFAVTADGSTQGLVNRFNLYAKSMPKGSVPSLNVGMKSCIPASLTKGFHGYTYK